jgi:hypothetical protein
MLKIRIYKSTVLSLVLKRCEMWYLIFKEVHQLQECENKVLWEICGPMKDEVHEQCKISDNDDLLIYTRHLALVGY